MDPTSLFMTLHSPESSVVMSENLCSSAVEDKKGKISSFSLRYYAGIG